MNLIDHTAGRFGMDGEDAGALEQELVRLRAEHRRLDTEIVKIVEAGFPDQLEMQRLKKQKLRLKDRIRQLEDSLLPDIIA